jgi:prepilin-type N-terminal cleavage/methylation domain-containing protein
MATRRAFTLIELIIATSILLLLVVVGIAQYETYNRQNSLVMAGYSIQSFLESAQKEARSRSVGESLTTNYRGVSIRIESNGKEIKKYKKDATGSEVLIDTLELGKELSASLEGSIFYIFPTGNLEATKLVTVKTPKETLTLTVNENNISQTKSF